MSGKNNNIRKRPAKKQRQPSSPQTPTVDFDKTPNSSKDLPPQSSGWRLTVQFEQPPNPFKNIPPPPPPPPAPSSITQQQQPQPPKLQQPRNTINIKTNSTKQNKKLHPSFLPTLQHLSRPLAPLVSITTGLPHPDFPRTILAYHLLTSSQLDDLARHYHQIWPPVPETFGYPLRVPAWIGTTHEHNVDIETKRRRMGRFMGLRGCESPVDDADSAAAAGNWNWGLDNHAGDGAMMETETEAEMLERMEREWQEALGRARQEDADAALRRKAGGV
ncbi:hypothetical protein M432DRAFT_99445 [Thermoascus aurantiacus ATCC 26904]